MPMFKRGPYKTSKPKHLLHGQMFGDLTAIEYVRGGLTHPARWRCRCTCGRETLVQTKSLLSGNTKSCGHRRTTILQERNTTHGRAHTIEHNTWTRMIGRCENPKNRKYS